MAIPYTLIKTLEGKEPYLESKGRKPKQQAKYLMDENMKGIHLGACLDSCRWGGQIDVIWEMNINEMIGFIQNWMNQNPDNFQNLWHEKKISELYTQFELPYIRHKTCPRDKNHKGIFLDKKGKFRCAHTEIQRFKPSFIGENEAYFDSLSKLKEITFRDTQEEEYPITTEDWENYGEIENMPTSLQEEYNAWTDKIQEERTVEVNNPCFAILSDKRTVLSLETILKRLNLSPQTNTKILFPFDGWTLAFYAQKWYEQNPIGNASAFEPQKPI
jgi:hypothetical protein